ncbi:MAG: response regulator [Planctomycetota bacterium]
MRHIFFVHDGQEDPSTRRHYLESSGFRVSTFSSGEDAIKEMAIDRPDGVIMDILLEGRNGFEICREIRKLHSRDELPVILCSAVYRQPVYREEAADAGAQGYLLRPFALGEMVRHLKAAIDRTPVASTR